MKDGIEILADQINKTTHTKTPWTVDDTVGGDYLHPEIAIYWKAPYQNDGSRYHIATVAYPSSGPDTVGRDELKANAAFIVRAVNAHEELKRRLMLMASSFHHLSNHEGYSKDCPAIVCRTNYEVLTKANGCAEEAK